MADASINQLQVELTAAEDQRAVLKQEFFGIHAIMVQKKAELDRLKSIHDTSSNSNKYAKSLEVEGAIAELMQKEGIIKEAIKEIESNIILLRYRIENKR